MKESFTPSDEQHKKEESSPEKTKLVAKQHKNTEPSNKKTYSETEKLTEKTETQPSLKKKDLEYVKILSEIEHAIEESGEKQKEYITNRIEKLSINAKSGEISHVGLNIHKGFLGPKMEIRRNMMVEPFIMNDQDLYSDLFDTIKIFQKSESWKNQPLRKIMMIAIQWTLSKYFGNIASGVNTEIENQEFYLRRGVAESPSISIKELKEKGFAVCAEKGAAAQNLLAFTGLESDLIASNGCRIPAEAEESPHYYILIHGPKGEMIYDPTNPRLLFDKDDKLTNYGPAIYDITKEKAHHLVSGESITTEHIDYKTNKDGQIVPDKSERLYAGICN